MRFPKTQLGWRLMRQSLSVFHKQKKLLILPCIGRGAFFLMAYLIILFAWLIRIGYIHYAALSGVQIFWIYIAVLGILFAGNIISAYFRAALMACLLQYESESPIQLKQGLAAASKRLGLIFLWLLMHFTVGLTMMIFQKKTRSGLDWPAASFFMAPLISNEPTGIKTLLRRSDQLILDFAGSHPVPHYSFFWLFTGLRLLAFIPTFLSYLSNETTVIMGGVILTALLLILLAIFYNAFYTVFMQALYQYAAHGKTSRHFNTSDLAATFHH